MKRLAGMVCLYIVSMSVYAESGFGICDFGNVTLPSIVCSGPGFLKNTIVKGDIRIAGNMEAHDIQAAAVSVTGSLTIDRSKIGGQVDVAGNLEASQTEFAKSIIVSGTTVVLNHSRVFGEVKINSTVTKPTLRLVCGSVIAGTVNFGNLEGVVQVTGDSMVQGKVINGTLEFIKESCPQ